MKAAAPLAAVAAIEPTPGGEIGLGLLIATGFSIGAYTTWKGGRKIRQAYDAKFQAPPSRYTEAG